jgi:hypothetical protein
LMKHSLTAALLIFALTTSARAGVVMYTDVASFNAATSGNATTTLSFPTGSGPFLPSYTNGNVSFTAPGAALEQFNDGGYGAGVSYLAGYGGSTLNLAITGNFTAFALTLGVYGADPIIGSTVEFSLNGGPGVGLSIPGRPNSRFIGFTDNDPITNISITNLSGFTEQDVQSFTTAFAAAAPEPATWAMMLIGFVGLGIAGYKRARHCTVAHGGWVNP